MAWHATIIFIIIITITIVIITIAIITIIIFRCMSNSLIGGKETEFQLPEKKFTNHERIKTANKAEKKIS